MGTLEILMLRGGSSAVYPFRVYFLPADLPNTGAVLVFSRRTMGDDGRGTHNLIHISQTRDLAQGLADYKNLPCFKKHHANCVCVYLEDDERHRSVIESDLLRYYSAPCDNYPLVDQMHMERAP